MADFDPFTATRKEAESRGGAAVRAWHSAQKLLDDCDYYLANPMIGMSICAKSRIIAPDWLARAFVAGVDKVWHFEVKSWNEAFKIPDPGGKRKRAEASEEYQRRAGIAVERVLAKNPKRSIDNDFWDEIGALIGRDQFIDPDELSEADRHRGLKRTAAQTYHTAALKSGQARPISELRKRLLPERPKKKTVRKKPRG